MSEDRERRLNYWMHRALDYLNHERYPDADKVVLARHALQTGLERPKEPQAEPPQEHSSTPPEAKEEPPGNSKEEEGKADSGEWGAS